MGAKIVENVRIDTTHFVTTEGRGQQWEKAVDSNIPVVRPEWVDACEKGGRILGVTKFYLDAMKPGPPPPEEQTPVTPAAEKDLPAAPQAEKPEDKKDEAEEKKSEEAPEAKEGADKPEQKAKATPKEEQKVRFEDVKEQKMALRPGGEADSPRGSNEADARKSEGDDEDVSAKPVGTPDGSSFQEVEL